MLYFAAQGHPAAIMITASHNPSQYNGFKLCRENAIPISGDTGIKEIKKLVEKNAFKDPGKKGIIISKELLDSFITFNTRVASYEGNLRIVIDTGNGMSGYTVPKVFKQMGIRFINLFPELDGTFPNHESNPLKYDTLAQLQQAVKKEKANLGIAFDGDGDRCGFVDEKGNIIPNDITLGIIAAYLVRKNPGATVLYDLRSTSAVREEIESAGGKAVMSRVGHAFIKQQMRELDAIFAGELAGHFYYKNAFFTESSILTSLLIMNLIATTKKPLSKLAQPLMRYYQSGELNFEVPDKDKALAAIENHYSDADDIKHLDGVSIYYDDWWFNLRKSNTEPIIRLNLEAKSRDDMQQHKDQIVSLLKSFSEE
jgi:phosphomannomutase